MTASGGTAAIPEGLLARAQAWLADDPDPADQAELRALLAAAGEPGLPGAAAREELASRFAGRLRFGTAGLRGRIGAGPNRMNRAVVRGTTAALAGWLTARSPGAGAAGVVIGRDARHRSAEFAREAAAVLTGAGIRVHLLPEPSPTPLLAFAIRHLAAAAGVMITASHNPPADNGYKLYLADGAQIVPPADEEIEAATGRLGPLAQIPLGPATPDGGRLATRHGDEVASAYLDAITAAVPSPPEAGRDLRVVYTPLHGVAGPLAARAMARAGFPPPLVVAAQADPDPDFPTVASPNPEEPGALDLALEAAQRAGADLVLASDPDGDRLAVAVPAQAPPGETSPGRGAPAQAATGKEPPAQAVAGKALTGRGEEAPPEAAAENWRMLTGDQVGALLGAFLLTATADEPAPGQRLVVTTVVSSTLLGRIAALAGARYAETLTGFKWIMRAGGQVPGSRFLFGYEEALGYAVGETIRDKDGISAALAVASLAATARAAGRSLAACWDELETTHGVHLTAQLTVATGDPGEVMARLRRTPPPAFGGHPVRRVTDLAGGAGPLPPADVLTWWLPGGRVAARPSGTEPRLKVYLEVVEPVTAGRLAAARTAAATRIDALRTAVTALLRQP